MKILTFLLVIFAVSGAELARLAPRFNLNDDEVDWNMPKSRCEDLGGRLAVLDTPEKLSALREQVGPFASYPWIGFHDLYDNDKHVWLNGNPVSEDTTFWAYDYPTHGNFDCDFINLQIYKWSDEKCPYDGPFVCEMSLCNTGYYRVGGDCVMCIGNTVKSTVGNDTSCPTVCDGMAKVPNSGHTTCVCNTGYYKNGSDCVMCSGNRIKPVSSDDTNCTASCDGMREVANVEHTACMCAAGHKMLKDGFCYEYKRSGFYDLQERNVGIISEEAIFLQVGSEIMCSVECMMRSCNRFSFQQQAPDVRICNISVTVNVTKQPLDGASYYIKP